MKKLALTLGLVISVGISLLTAANTPVQAQGDSPTGLESIDTILARAAAKGFLVTLTRPELSNIREFYVLDGVNTENLLAETGNVTSYDIVQADWLEPDVVYEVEANLQPSNQTIVIQTGKYDGRWRVQNIELASTTGPATGGVAAASSQTRPVVGNGSGQLAFQTQNGGDIYVINADGTGLRRVTRGIDPQLSPDGTKIAFTRWESGFELYTINVDGTNETLWFSNKVQMKSPTWSADGSRLVFSHRVFFDAGGDTIINFQKLAEKSIQQGEQVNIPEIPGNAKGLEVDANGKVKFVVPPDAHWSLGQVDLTRKEFRDLSTGNQYNYAPSGHPTDPNRLIFRGDKGLAVYDTLSQTSQPTSFDDRDRGAVVISPDGSKIALTYWQDGHWEIHTMNADGSNRQRLTETPLSVIAQNSRSEIFVNEEGYRTITRAQPDGQLSPHWNNAAPAWSPDGSKIAFMTDRTGQWEIWIMNADGSDQRAMFPNGALDELTFNYAGVDERMISWR